MARAPCIDFPDAIYHVMARGNNKSIVFEDTRDYQSFKERLERALTFFRLNVMPIV